ncbi:unnamed protein product [Arctia plantaginis]|uniref:Uncharacterized protein n=1 Tax=Arctia plantaginis TaxID=874455 RepID=A0A8S0YRK2_ARCPL|nr:unnamed protein product [Arctia plantaginis]
MNARTIGNLNLSPQEVSKNLTRQCSHLADIEEELCYELVGLYTFHQTLAAFERPALVKTPEEVDAAADEISRALQTALRASTSTRPRSERQDPLPHRIRKMLEEKREAKKLWQRTRHPRAKARYNQATNKVKAALWEHRGDAWEDVLLTIEDEQPSIHQLCKKISAEPTPTRPLFGHDDLLRYQAQDRAEFIAHSLERQFMPHADQDEDHTRRIEEATKTYPSTPYDQIDGVTLMTPAEVATAIRRTNPRKAPGANNRQETPATEDKSDGGGHPLVSQSQISGCHYRQELDNVAPRGNHHHESKVCEDEAASCPMPVVIKTATPSEARHL